MEIENEEWIVIKKNKDNKITPHKAKNYQTKYHIDYLADTLLSEQTQLLFEKGWKFCTVFKGDNQYVLPPSDDEKYSYFMIDINNKWGDKVVLKKSKSNL